jgi:LysR family transcriptional regulator, nitrogen assimilation regulatory protein
MDLRQIQYFVALYEEESITKAAKRLRVVQPAVSMQIRRLETDHGVTLFDRTSQGVVPNATAHKLYPLCREAMQQADRLDCILRDASGELVGSVSLGVPPTLTSEAFSDVLEDFHQNNPRVQLRIQEGYSASLLDWLVQGELDAAIVVSGHNERRLSYKVLAMEDLVLAVGADTPWHRDRVAAAELSAFKLVLPSPRNSLRVILDAHLEQTGIVLRPTMEVDSLNLVLHLLRSPGWASILPRSTVQSHTSAGGLRVLELVDPSVQRGLMLAHLPHRDLSLPAQRLVAQIVQRLFAR